MLKRSGKIQFLFWSSFFSIIFYLWFLTIGLNTFILNKNQILQQPTNTIILMFLLIGILIFLLLSGTVVSIMINNKFYRNFFGSMIIITFITLLLTRGIFG